MKKAALLILIFTVLFAFGVPFSAAADEEELYAGICSELDEALQDSDIGITAEEASQLDFTGMMYSIGEILSERIKAPLKMLAVLLSVIIFTSFIRTSQGSGDSGIYSMVCVLSAAAAVLPLMFRVYEESCTAVTRTGGFITVFVPVFAGLTAAVGSLGTAGVYNILLLFASELVVSTAGKYMMPVISMVTALSVSGSVFSDTSLDKIALLIKKIVLWAMTTAMTLFTGFVTMKCSIAAKAEGAASKTVKLAVSGAVPIVGGAVSDAFSTVCGSFDVIRTSVGAVGAYAILLAILPSVLEIAVFRGVMWIASAAAELFSSAPAAKLLNALDSGLAIVQSLLICYILMFILCTGVLLNCCGE